MLVPIFTAHSIFMSDDVDGNRMGLTIKMLVKF